MTDTMLTARIAQIEPWIIEKRRALHQVPELGFQEFETQRVITEALEECGIPYTVNRTWVVGLIEGAHPGKTVALRADMDALPVTEPKGACDFASQREGFMHACGHDAHMAIQLGAARVLNEYRGEMHGNVKLLFQPAEESLGGAEPMIAAGVMENPHVDEVYGVHVMPYLPVGKIETRPGTLNASTDEIRIRVLGRSGHGAYPDEGADAILAAAHIVCALNTIVSRNISPLQSGVISICQMNGGRAHNILCGDVSLVGTLRATTPHVREQLHNRVREMATYTAQAMGCEAIVEIIEGYCALINEAHCAQKVLTTAARLFGSESALTKEASSMGGEDFAYFLLEAPGAFYNVGCGTPGKEDCPPLHSEHFTINEGCLAVGAAMQVALALDVLREDQV